MTLYFRSGCSDLDEIQQADAEQNADYGKMFEIGTGSRIPIWWTFVFPNRKSLYLSHKLMLTLMLTKFGLLIDFDLLKARTSTNTKPEVVLSDRGRHLKKQYDVIFPQ